MCGQCREVLRESVSLIREYPKNKVGPDTTPAQYLEGWDIARGLYDLIDKISVRQDEEKAQSPIVGYFTAYRGVNAREYSSPMFTFKDNVGGACYYCVTYPDSEDHPQPRKYADIGCVCGNVAYTGKDCEAHPLPSIDSRWVRMNQARDCFCNHCNERLEQESYDPEIRWYCGQECKDAYDEDLRKRREKWEKLRERADVPELQ